jgi:hypothetical protein
MELAQLSNDDLIDEITTWAARVARGEAKHLDLIAELDTRKVWVQHSATSCAQWLSWKLGWCRTTARERVRVAQALRSLPLIHRAFGEGQLSYSQVRAVTRVATADDEPRWLELARCSTGGQLDKIARGAARARAADLPADERPRPTASKSWDDNGDLLLTLRTPAHQALPVLAVLEQHQAAEQADRDATIAELITAVTTSPVEAASAEAPDDELAVALAAEQRRGLDPLEPYPFVEPPHPISADRWGLQLTPAEEQAITRWRAKLGRLRDIRDAWDERREQLLVEVSARRVTTGRASLADGLIRALTHPAAGDTALVILRLLVDPISGWARDQRDELLPPPTLAGLLDATPEPRGATKARHLDLCRHDRGRATRAVHPALRRLLGQVDGERCRFPGCDHTRFLNAHHVLFWRNGGRTDLSNLVLLCTRHHRLLHQAGYVLTLHPDRTLTVLAPDGTLLEHHPSLPTASAEALPAARPDVLPPTWTGERLDLGYAVTAMLSHAA